ncbi:hypothetical protein [Streptomyces sp. KR80]|uniref:hypothetical protein n=1 Tax=Streptomyces sp. KR80 TaxID=3457426 RepID=UPI003FD07FED
MTRDVIAIIGVGGMGQVIARRMGSGTHLPGERVEPHPGGCGAGPLLRHYRCSAAASASS